VGYGAVVRSRVASFLDFVELVASDGPGRDHAMAVDGEGDTGASGEGCGLCTT